MSTNQIERRMVALAELRADDNDDDPSIDGYAATFGILSQDLGGFREVVAPGAFRKSLKGGADVRCLFNHDANQVLGRRSAGTLDVQEDDRGLKFTTMLDPDNTAHMNIRSSIRRGDINQCSFAFVVDPDGDVFDEVQENGVRFVRRTLRSVNLMDVSPVTYPAYNTPGATVVNARHALLNTNTNPEVEARRLRLKNSLEDSARRSRAHEILMQILDESK
jgi:HK97 family phage prohead protease